MMTQDSTCPQKGPAADGRDRFIGLLSEALALADSLPLPPEIGARLQELLYLTAQVYRNEGTWH
jgi:hypothetical protein